MEGKGRRNHAADARTVALNFKVTAAFRRELKTFAAKTDRTMVQVLYDGFDMLTADDKIENQRDSA